MIKFDQSHVKYNYNLIIIVQFIVWPNPCIIQT